MLALQLAKAATGIAYPMRGQGAIKMWPVRENQKVNKYLHWNYMASCLNYTTTMGRKCISNDADLVQLDQYVVPKNKRAKI